MPSAAHAYRYDAYAQAEPLRQPRTRVRILHERRREPGISPIAVQSVKLFMAAIAIVAAVCFVSLAFSAATVSSTFAKADITEQADALESDNAQLQMRIASLTAPSYVKDRATALGMHAPESIDSIVLSDDSAVYNEDGSLSLSDSITASSSN